MKKRLIRFAGIVATGLLATVTMDFFALVTVATGLVELGPYRIVPNLLGRWVGSLAVGRKFEPSILEASSLPHEAALGISLHYLIGLVLTAVLVYPNLRFRQRTPNVSTALLFGIATTAFPYFLMFPAMGFGVMGLRVGHSSTLMLFSGINHIAFGVGIFFWSRLLFTDVRTKISISAAR